jgi:CheY-like chemotaxis protein
MLERRSPKDLPQAAALVGKSALCVDDHDVARATLMGQLAGLGLHAEGTADGAAALARLQQGRLLGRPAPDVVFIDLNLGRGAMDGLSLSQAMRAEPGLCAAPIVLLSPLGSKRDEGGAAIAAHLNKPVHRQRLHDCLVHLFKHDQKPSSGPATPLATASPLTAGPPASAAATGPVRVLLVEDNKVNQLLALAYLKKLGLVADLAHNGRQAVEALSRKDYALILMDCQMPEMDGFEATLHIRRMTGGKEQTPIIAMTANAMKGDRELCLQVGMNDYLAKPVRLDELRKAVGPWLKTPGGDQEADR